MGGGGPAAGETGLEPWGAEPRRKASRRAVRVVRAGTLKLRGNAHGVASCTVKASHASERGSHAHNSFDRFDTVKLCLHV